MRCPRTTRTRLQRVLQRHSAHQRSSLPTTDWPGMQCPWTTLTRLQRVLRRHSAHLRRNLPPTDWLRQPLAAARATSLAAWENPTCPPKLQQLILRKWRPRKRCLQPRQPLPQAYSRGKLPGRNQAPGPAGEVKIESLASPANPPCHRKQPSRADPRDSQPS